MNKNLPEGEKQAGRGMLHSQTSHTLEEKDNRSAQDCRHQEAKWGDKWG